MNAIEFENISKQYRLGLVSSGTISHDLNRWWTVNVLRKEDPYLKIGETNDRATKGNSQYVWALKDINFSVEEGDVVGIIGKNGAGKSTLLKLLSRVTAPTTGVIRARGRIASLLEVGTGFHPEMTGRENIYMNGAIMGMTKAEITRKLDEIVDFSGCERYIDTPVKRYSSGMTVRLGFAIAAHLEPEILVVDEVLAVGDAEFQKKAIGKMQDVSKGEGRTVLFVSHNMAAVKNLCKRGLVLNNGTCAFIGSVDDAINLYQGSAINQTTDIKQNIKYLKSFIKIESISINESTSPEITIQSGQRFLTVDIRGQLLTSIKMDMILTFYSLSGQALASFANAVYLGEATEFQAGKFHLNYRIELPLFVGEGDTLIDIRLYEPRVQDIMAAPNCAKIHFDGNMNKYCRPLRIKDEGFMGLNYYNNN